MTDGWETVRRIKDTTAATKDKVELVSLMAAPVKPHVFAKPLVKKRKESGMNALGIVKKVKLIYTINIVRR